MNGQDQHHDIGNMSRSDLEEEVSQLRNFEKAVLMWSSRASELEPGCSDAKELELLLNSYSSQNGLKAEIKHLKVEVKRLTAEIKCLTVNDNPELRTAQHDEGKTKQDAATEAAAANVPVVGLRVKTIDPADYMVHDEVVEGNIVETETKPRWRVRIEDPGLEHDTKRNATNDSDKRILGKVRTSRGTTRLTGLLLWQCVVCPALFALVLWMIIERGDG